MALSLYIFNKEICIMVYHCRRCGKPFESDDVTEFFCEHCRTKKNENPNAKIFADVREATKRGLTYGHYKGLPWHKK
jgi:predicted amidophosphoribosyltransferase